MNDCSSEKHKSNDRKKNVSKNVSNFPLTITERIDDYFIRFPSSKPKQACADLKIDYERYKKMVRTEKCKIRRYLRLGRPHRPHRRVWASRLAADDLAVVKVACVDRKVKGRWYRSSNRNRMMCFLGDRASIKVWETRTVRVEPHVDMTKKDCEDFLWDKLVFAAGVNSQRANLIVDSLETMSQHRVFPIGEPLPRFKIEHYKKPLGLTIYTDGSHPFAVEVEEGWPDWIKALIKAESQRTRADVLLAKNIETHVAVQKNILEATVKLNELLDRHLEHSVSQRSISHIPRFGGELRPKLPRT